jgi:hypothetical protein
MSEPLNLPNFQKALRPYATDFSVGTFWRYGNGLLPAFTRWLVSHPDVLAALLSDARARSTATGNDTTGGIVHQVLDREAA